MNSIKELYCKGARVWVPHPDKVWQSADVLADYSSNQLKLLCEDGTETILTPKNDDDFPKLRNPDILIGENDLTALSYLHEPAVLYNLQFRFINQSAIYTYCGIVLVAINPYADLPIYGNDTIFAYRGQAMGDLDPHIFAVAEAAYTKMEKEDENQSIIVSGESGAGKTVSAKYAMRYFATIGGSATETQIEKKVLASSPVMEAIGNAKTTRNDNSSRFGKYIDLDFNRAYNIIGASMRTYLLEKSRVVFQAPDERNYHIFYQLCASRNLPEFKDLELAHQDEFNYTSQGCSPDIEGVDDASDFRDTLAALTMLGFDKASRTNMFRVLAAILHLGNVHIRASVDGDEDASTVPANDKHLLTVAKLLAVKADSLRKWLCNRKITSAGEVFTKSMTVSEAMFSRDALAKHVYAQLFDWIVGLLNVTLATSEKGYRFIGVLDIYGFETFEINSFEQFCINYANEKLQQQFNQHVFKLEQEEYMREKIEWQFIDFYDNQPCIDLIESKLGILDLLDEECKMPRGSDQSWVEKLFAKCSSSKHFSKPRLSNTAFVINHFADMVQYESGGFLEKNRDTVVEDQIDVLKTSSNELILRLFADESGKKETPKARTPIKITPVKSPAQVSSKQHKQTVGSQFRQSLSLLMATLNPTTPHYVRCIKPNDDKESFAFDPKRAVQQLRACGVLETIRISAAGYPSRWTYLDFFLRYRVLCCSKDVDRQDMQLTCKTILNNVIRSEDQYQFGRTKIFIRAGQVAYLEKLRGDKLRACGVMIQKHIRGWLIKNRYQKLRKATIRFQAFARRHLARKLAQKLRENRAAIIIQKRIKGYVARCIYLRTCTCILRLQARIRGAWARQRYDSMRRNAKALIIQRHVRGFLARQRYHKRLHNIVVVQSCVRRWFARRELKKLKVEARSVEHVKKLNKGLENKIISLQQKIEEMNKESAVMKTHQNELIQLRAQLEGMKRLEAAHKACVAELKELQMNYDNLGEKYRHEQEEKIDIVNEKEQLILETKNKETQMAAEIEKLHLQLQECDSSFAKQTKEIEDACHKKLNQEKLLLTAEYDQERKAYQKLLKDYNLLEEEHENLAGQMVRLRGQAPSQFLRSHQRNSSNVSTISGTSESTTVCLPEFEATDSHSVTSDAQDEDGGYAGSLRSTTTAATGDTGPMSLQQVDISLLLKLQQKVKELEQDKTHLKRKLDKFEKDESPIDYMQQTQEHLRLQELEMENAKLRTDLTNWQKSVAESDTSSAKTRMLIAQFQTKEEELQRRRDECIQLRAALTSQAVNFKEVGKSYTGRDVDIVNEDGELVMAFETQKKIIRQLESELQEKDALYKDMEGEYRVELDKLKQDNDRQQKLLAQNLTKTPQSQTEAYMQHEITRLTGENLDLREKYDAAMEQLRKYKRHLKIYSKKLKEAGTGQDITLEIAEVAKERDMPVVVRKKDTDYLGMFEYKKEDENQIIRTLIYELSPKTAITLLPGLPAYILFMCIRHTDFINDDEKVRSLLTQTVNTVKRVIKKRHEDLETTVLWLSNTLRLLHNLKQYSGDKPFQTENNTRQNEQCLRNFDLSEYRQVLSDIAVWIYQAVIKLMEERVQALIVPAILEHEMIPGLSGSGQRPGTRGRTSSVSHEMKPSVDAQLALKYLLHELTTIYKMLGMHGVDPELISQVFRQIFYFICAGALNNLLLRKDLCHWSKGMQIRYNISHIEQWCRDQKLQDGGVLDTLQPIIQAAQLLQARKTDEDVPTICEMCNKLTPYQVVKILNLYTPADEFEERVAVSFIRKIQQQLQERTDSRTEGPLLMDTKFAFSVYFPFNPSNIRLEDIDIPEVLNLPMLKKV